jgi:hypothetical protein
LGNARQSSASDLSGLQEVLAQLIGETFRFFRISYGDEATLHFGNLHPARSPKLKDKLYGTYILGLRASSWLFKCGSGPTLINAGIDLPSLKRLLGEPISSEDFESKEFVQPDSAVISATALVTKPLEGLALQLCLSDASTLFVMPIDPALDEQSPENEEGVILPEISDWQLLSPYGLLEVGPGCNGRFEPTATSDSPVQKACG